MWSKNDEIVQSWLRENRYTSHQVVNELITILGQSLLRNVFGKMKDVTGPAWFSDEATDVASASASASSSSSEQLNLTIRWVTDGHEVHEDQVGLFRVPDHDCRNSFYSDQGYAHPVQLATIIM